MGDTEACPQKHNTREGVCTCSLSFFKEEALHGYEKKTTIVKETQKSEEEKKKKQETQKIKGALSRTEKIHNDLPQNSTWFEALFKRRDEIIKEVKDKIENGEITPSERFNPDIFPYTNRKISKHLGKEPYGAYDLMLKNEHIVESLAEIARRQRSMGNKSEIFSSSFMDEYVKKVSFKGIVPSFESKVGYCLSGDKTKRHPLSSTDATIISLL